MVLLQYLDGVFGYAMALTRNSFEAEDLVQETYVRAMETMGRLREDSNIKAWLFTILRNIWLNQIRQQRARPQLLELDMDDKSAGLAVETAKDPHSLYVTKIETEQVHEALQQLPEELREIIVLREFAEHSYQEIAALLQLPRGTVMSRLSRARVRLGKVLSPSQSISNNRVSSQGALSSQASKSDLQEMIGTITE